MLLSAGLDGGGGKANPLMTSHLGLSWRLPSVVSVVGNALQAPGALWAVTATDAALGVGCLSSDVAVDCGTGAVVDCGKGVAVDCGTGVVVDCGTGVAVDCGTGVAVDCGTGVVVDCGRGVAVDCGTSAAVGCGTDEEPCCGVTTAGCCEAGVPAAVSTPTC